ncbi:MAG: hypothetical protein LBQ98_01090 [Nitrososphaerota archaeon]|nr:hypothetical protein [Nitrososphaerota archaeon]
MKQKKQNKIQKTVQEFSKPGQIANITQTNQKITTTQDSKETKFTCPKRNKNCSTYNHRWKTFRHLNW